MIQGVQLQQINQHPDERGFFEELIRKNDQFFSEGFGQLSHSHMHDGVVKAWHIHKTQIDWWCVIRGTLKVALYDTRKESVTFRELQELTIGESGEKCILKIPAGVAHGLKVIEGPCDLVYVTSTVYTPDEEGRIAYNDEIIGYDRVQGKPITNTKIT